MARLVTEVSLEGLIGILIEFNSILAEEPLREKGLIGAKACRHRIH